MGIGYATAFVGGIATLLSPCAAMLLPAFLAYAFTSRTTLLGRTGLLYAGMLTTLVPLGAAAGGLGGLLSAHRSTLVVVASLVVVALGVVQALGIPVRVPWRRTRRGASDAASPLSVYLLGTAYGVAGVCSGPILGSIVTVAALGGDPVYGAVLLAVYAAGMLLPVLVLALLWDRFDLGGARWLRPRPVRLGPVTTTVGNLISGALFIGVGVLLLLTEGTAGMSGVLGVDAQQQLEQRLSAWGAGVPDLAVVAALALGALAVAAAARRSTRRDRRDTPREQA